MTFTPKRVCPLLERESRTERLPHAPEPWVLRRCVETGFVFLENPPAYEAFEEQFAWEATSARESASRREDEPVLYAVSTGMKNFRRRVLKRHKIRDLSHAALGNSPAGCLPLLDIGCGWGGLLEEVVTTLEPGIRERCVPHGIELSRELAKISQERLGASGGACIQDNALNGLARFPADHFQLILMSSFLEHEINPLSVLRQCHTRLRAGGHIVIKVPNFASVNRVVRGPRWCGFRWPDHVNYFTPGTLRDMAGRAGLKVDRMTFFDRHPFSDNMYAVLVKPRPQPA